MAEVNIFELAISYYTRTAYIISRVDIMLPYLYETLYALLGFISKFSLQQIEHTQQIAHTLHRHVTFSVV